MDMSEARYVAASIWCEGKHSGKAVNSELVESIAEKLVLAFKAGHEQAVAKVSKVLDGIEEKFNQRETWRDRKTLL